MTLIRHRSFAMAQRSLFFRVDLGGGSLLESVTVGLEDEPESARGRWRCFRGCRLSSVAEVHYGVKNEHAGVKRLSITLFGIAHQQLESVLRVLAGLAAHYAVR